MTPADPAKDNPRRAGYPAELRQRAAAMRREGSTRADIARGLGISFSTVARWFRVDGVPATMVPGRSGGPAWRLSHRRTIEERWAHHQVEQDAHGDAVGPLSERELLLVGAALYWAEGTKAKPWRRSHLVALMNSDGGVIRVFLAYLAVLGVPRSSVHCQLSIHESADVQAADGWWRDLVGHDIAFHPPSLKRHNPSTVRLNTGKDYRGCLAVRLWQGADVYRRIVGTWEGVAAAVVDGPRSPVV